MKIKEPESRNLAIIKVIFYLQMDKTLCYKIKQTRNVRMTY